MRKHVLLGVALFAICFSGAAIAASSPSSKLAGKWSGTYSGAFAGKFTLHWRQTGSKLTGSITLSNPAGQYSISGRMRDGKIQFGVVGAGATYKGSVHGTSMRGSYISPRGGGTWSAHKTSK